MRIRSMGESGIGCAAVWSVPAVVRLMAAVARLVTDTRRPNGPDAESARPVESELPCFADSSGDPRNFLLATADWHAVCF